MGEDGRVGVKVIKGLKVGVSVDAGVDVGEGVGVYFLTLTPGVCRTTVSATCLAQSIMAKLMAIKIRINIFPYWVRTDLYNSVILMHLF